MGIIGKAGPWRTVLIERQTPGVYSSLAGNVDFSHLEGHIAAVAGNIRADLYQLLLEAG